MISSSTIQRYQPTRSTQQVNPSPVVPTVFTGELSSSDQLQIMTSIAERTAGWLDRHTSKLVKNNKHLG